LSIARRAVYRPGMTGLTTTNPEAIAAVLEERYVDAGAEQGSKLPSERDLALRLGVSRPVVREAMRILIERGLVEVAPGRGAFVRVPRPFDAARPLAAIYRRGQATTRDLIEARSMLEGEAARLAAERCTAEELVAIERLLVQLERESEPAAQARQDLAFHTLISRATRNPVLEAMFASISGLVFEHLLRSNAEPVIGREANPYQREVVVAIRRRDPEAAQRAMRDHLMVAYRRYGDDLDVEVKHLARRVLEREFGPRGGLEDLLRSVADEDAVPTMPRPPTETAPTIDRSG
jgi:GntR family transcriptional regulator, transcriptional repressor for pyruvate dehydrogenase complex